MMIDNDVLKYISQCPRLMHMLAMLMIFSKYLFSLTITLRYFHKTLSGLEADKLLHLSMTLVNFLFEKGLQVNESLVNISFSRATLIYQFCTELNVWYNAYQRFSISMQGFLLYYIASIASNFYFLIQFMRSQSLQFFDMIS